jgi:ornithine cyclodeaminase
MGPDFPHKRELHPEVLGRADLVVADSLADCAEAGEIHHALEAATVRRETIAELSTVVSGAVPGRTGDGQITVADQCGLGAYDAAIAEFVLTQPENQEGGT